MVSLASPYPMPNGLSVRGARDPRATAPAIHGAARRRLLRGGHKYRGLRPLSTQPSGWYQITSRMCAVLTALQVPSRSDTLRQRQH